MEWKIFTGGFKADLHRKTLDASFRPNFRHFYRPQRSCGQGYVFTRVCDSVNRGGGGVSGEPPSGPRRNPPDQADPPSAPGRPPLCTRQTPPRREEQQHTVNERPVRILLECILVKQFFGKIGRHPHAILELSPLGNFGSAPGLVSKK